MLSSPRPSQRGAVIAVFAIALLLIAAALITRYCTRQTPVAPTVKSYMIKLPADTAGATAATKRPGNKKRSKPARKHRKENRRDKSAAHHTSPAQRNPLDEKL